MLIELPGQAGGRQELGARINVALELRAERQPPPAAERDLVLGEHVGPAQRRCIGEERQLGAVRHAVVGAPMAAAPSDELVLPGLERVLRFGVERVEALGEAAGNLALSVVVVDLRLHAAAAGQLASDAAKKIAA